MCLCPKGARCCRPPGVCPVDKGADDAVGQFVLDVADLVAKPLPHRIDVAGLVLQVDVDNWYARYSEGSSAIIPKGLILSLIAVAGLMFTGWKGWEMVYRHRVGVADQSSVADQSTRTPRRAA